MAEMITDGQKSFLLSLGYNGPKPIDELTKEHAAVCINSRLAAKRSKNTDPKRRTGASLMASAYVMSP